MMATHIQTLRRTLVLSLSVSCSSEMVSLKVNTPTVSSERIIFLMNIEYITDRHPQLQPRAQVHQEGRCQVRKLQP